MYRYSHPFNPLGSLGNREAGRWRMLRVSVFVLPSIQPTADIGSVFPPRLRGSVGKRRIARGSGSLSPVNRRSSYERKSSSRPDDDDAPTFQGARYKQHLGPRLFGASCSADVSSAEPFLLVAPVPTAGTTSSSSSSSGETRRRISPRLDRLMDCFASVALLVFFVDGDVW